MPLAAATGQSDSSITPQAHELHFSSIVIDTHDDTTQRLLDPKFDLGARHSDGGIDIPRMREGGLSAIFLLDLHSRHCHGPHGRPARPRPDCGRPRGRSPPSE